PGSRLERPCPDAGRSRPSRRLRWTPLSRQESGVSSLRSRQVLVVLANRRPPSASRSGRGESDQSPPRSVREHQARAFELGQVKSEAVPGSDPHLLAPAALGALAPLFAQDLLAESDLRGVLRATLPPPRRKPMPLSGVLTGPVGAALASSLSHEDGLSPILFP